MSIRDIFFNPAKNRMIEFIRSLFVGAAAFAADFLTLALLKELGDINTLVASTLGFVVGVTVNYLLSNFWAFRSSNVDNAIMRFTIFVLIAIIGLIINNLIISLFDETLADMQLFGEFIQPKRYYMVGKIVATIVVFFWNFFSRKLLLYRDKKDSEQE
ncbi:MAG: GtrA family protein [Oscillospiraceae bacterium]|nr:GtrA family protein [Oscillospiraceae bacterium]